MAEIGRELDHLAAGILAVTIPADHRPRGEAMPEIVDARTSAMASEPLRLPQPDPLTDRREVVSGAAVTDPGAALPDEQGLLRFAKHSIAFRNVHGQAFDHARLQR